MPDEIELDEAQEEAMERAWEKLDKEEEQPKQGEKRINPTPLKHKRLQKPS